MLPFPLLNEPMEIEALEAKVAELERFCRSLALKSMVLKKALTKTNTR